MSVVIAKWPDGWQLERIVSELVLSAMMAGSPWERAVHNWWHNNVLAGRSVYFVLSNANHPERKGELFILGKDRGELWMEHVDWSPIGDPGSARASLRGYLLNSTAEQPLAWLVIERLNLDASEQTDPKVWGFGQRREDLLLTDAGFQDQRDGTTYEDMHEWVRAQVGQPSEDLLPDPLARLLGEADLLTLPHAEFMAILATK